jgi:ArsR family transcriptional regulator
MEMEKYFKALADNTRLRILNLLLHGELCGCDVQHVLGISQPNISRHLTYLKNAGLVLDRRVGFRIFYRLADPAQRSRKALFDYLRLAFRDVPALVKDMEHLRDSIKDGACTVSEWHPYSALPQVKSAGARVYNPREVLRAN